MGFRVLTLAVSLVLCLSPHCFGHVSHSHQHPLASTNPGYDLTSPTGWTRLDWELPLIGNVYTAGYGDALGVASFFRRQTHQWTTINEHRCLTSNFIAFDIDDEIYFDTNRDFKLELVIDSDDSGDLLIGYDRNYEPLLASQPVPTNSHGLVKLSIPLTQARFANRGTGATDIAIVTAATFNPPTPALDAQAASFTLCGLKLETTSPSENSARAPGILSLTIAENDKQTTQNLTAARLGIYQIHDNNQLRSILPNDYALELDFYQQPQRFLQLRRAEANRSWPVDNPHVFYTNGSYQQPLAPGRYLVAVTKGPEFEPLIKAFEISSNQRTQLDLKLQRWIDMPQRGWLSGDVHIHIPRDSNKDHSIQQWMQAEDLHVSNLVEMHNPGGRYFRQSDFGGRGISSAPTTPHWLVPGVEGPRTAQRGHTLALNIQRLVEQSHADLLYHYYLSAYQQQSAVTGYAHVGSREFNASLGLALDTPFDLVDFVEILQNGQLRTDFWYELLNLGFKLAPAAGSDFPYFDQPGAVRNYVQVKEDQTHTAWFDGLKNGATFVTNGPMLELTINGHSPGTTLNHLETPVQLVANAYVDPSRDRLQDVEVIHCGEVIESRSFVANTTKAIWQLDTLLELDQPGWYALRATSQKGLKAHTGAIYIKDQNNQHWCTNQFEKGIKQQLQRLNTLEDWVVDLTRELEFWQVESLAQAATYQRYALKQRIDKARDWYHQRLSEFQR